MGLEFRGTAMMEAIRTAAAKGLLMAAIRFENEHRLRVSVPNPPPYLNSSKPGQYMRLRTGAGQKALTHEPQSVAEVAQRGSVKVGFRQGDGDHMLILELNRQRLGLLKTLEDMRAQLAGIAVGEFRT